MKVSTFMISIYVFVVIFLALLVLFLLSFRDVYSTQPSQTSQPSQPSHIHQNPPQDKTPTYPTKNPEYPTRYNNDNFEQIGTLSSQSEDKIILPLFARRLHHDRYEYYTVTENDMKLRIDIKHNNRVCSDKHIGCDEIYDGDIVSVPSYNQDFVVSRYQYRV